MNAQWSLGVLVGLPVAGLIIIALIIAMALLIRKRPYMHANDQSYAKGLVWTAVIGMAAVLIFCAIAYWPYQAAYHQWRPVQGVVQDVSSRIIKSGDGISQRYVVKIDGYPYAVDDTRASLLKAGDRVSLMCKREWVYASASGEACRWSE